MSTRPFLKSLNLEHFVSKKTPHPGPLSRIKIDKSANAVIFDSNLTVS